MSIIDIYLVNPNSTWRKALLWASVTWEDVKNWVLRFVYAQHNARVIEDFEGRMLSVIHEATGGLMSKPYYTEEAMLQLIREHHNALREEGYEDALIDHNISEDAA